MTTLDELRAAAITEAEAYERYGDEIARKTIITMERPKSAPAPQGWKLSHFYRPAPGAEDMAVYERKTEVGTTPDGLRLGIKRGGPDGGMNLYLGGWRVGYYKTEGGLQRAIKRHSEGA